MLMFLTIICWHLNWFLQSYSVSSIEIHVFSFEWYFPFNFLLCALLSKAMLCWWAGINKNE